MSSAKPIMTTLARNMPNAPNSLAITTNVAAQEKYMGSTTNSLREVCGP